MVGDFSFTPTKEVNRFIIHCRKAEKECKYWLDAENFDIKEAYTFNMNNKDRRQVKKIIFEYFELIEDEWDQFQEGR
jgi:hypothetical protein